jgi:hypothetical protein
MRFKSGFVFLVAMSAALAFGCQTLANIGSSYRTPMTSERCVMNVERERLVNTVICDEALKDEDEVKCKAAVALIADLSLTECAQYPSIQDPPPPPPPEVPEVPEVVEE